MDYSSSYYGDIVAGQIDKNKKIVKKLSSEEITTCLFLPKEKLYLIPFYDLIRLKELTQNDKRMINLKAKC